MLPAVLSPQQVRTVQLATAVLPGAFIALVRSYVDAALAQWDGICLAVATEDSALLTEMAHSLWVASTLIGADRLTGCCHHLETAGRAQAPAAAAAVLPCLAQALMQTQQALAGVCAGVDVAAARPQPR